MRAWLALALALLARPAFAKGPSELERAREIAGADAWLQRVLAGSGDLQRSSRRADELAVTFSNRASAPIMIQSGRMSSVLATLEVDCPGAPAFDWIDGRALYAHAPGVTGIWTRAGDVLEQLLLVGRPGAEVLRWRLSFRRDVRRVVVEPTGALLFMARDGSALLRLPAPYAIDGDGKRLAVPLRWTQAARAGRLVVDLEFTLDLPGARWPVLVDPALEAVVWQQIPSAGAPPARSRHGFTYDPVAQRVVLFGGALPTPASDTWTYDGAWQSLSTSAPPPARYEHAMSYATKPPGTMVFGGRADSGRLGDTWRLEAGTWTEVATSGPGARDAAAMIGAPKLGSKLDALVLFGGGSSSALHDDTWEWSGSAWNVLAPPSHPTPRASHSMTYDSLQQRVLLFGGSFGASVQFSDLWSFDGSTWYELPKGPMAGRRSAAFAFDADRGVAVVFGGETTADLYDDTWEWDSALSTWTERVTLTRPAARAGTALAYDAHRKRVVLFGGYSFSGQPLADTWEYRVVSGTCSTAADCLGVPCVDGACCSAASCGTCSACSSSTGSCAPVLSGDDADSCTGDETCDDTGICKSKPGVACSAASECASGFCADGVCCNAPCVGACEACDVPSKVGSCTLVTGEARHGSCSGVPPCGSTCTGFSPSCTFAAPGTPCGASCDQALLVAKSCDGSGVCSASPPAACANGFACQDGAECRTTCGEDAHCQPGNVCRDQACVPPLSSCLNDVTELGQDGAPKDCTPYRCASGACGTSCSSADQCAPGFVCDARAECVRPGAAGAGDDASCACGVAGQRRGPPVWPLWLALVIAFRTRRAWARAGKPASR